MSEKLTYDGRQKWAHPDNSSFPHWDGEVVRRVLEERMLCGAPFVVGDLLRPIGHPWCYDTRSLVEGMVKRLRRQGLIAFKRYGGRVVWRAVTEQK